MPALIAYRPFRNNDPPDLLRIWNSQPPQRWLSQPLTVNRFEQLVLSHAYFKPQNLIVGTRNDRVIGFTHVGFGSSPDGSAVDPLVGAVCTLLVDPQEPFLDVANGLAFCADEIFRVAGTKRCIAGGLYPVDPFYWGLYGGPLSAGIMASDVERLEFFRNVGYRETARFAVWERPLCNFRPLVDRFQLQLKRKYSIEAANELVTTTWWESTIFSQVERARYWLRANDASPIRASATFWDMQHLEERFNKRTVGLLGAEFEPPHFADGTVVFLIGESLRHFQALGITHVLAEAPAVEGEWAKVFKALGFERLDESVILEKNA